MLNPTLTELKASQLDLVVAGTETAVLMVESEAMELPEDVMLGAVVFGHDEMQAVINMINEQSQRPNPQQSEQQQASAEEMAFLTQMMKEASENKKGPVNSGSRALNGGTTVRASAPTTGNAQGRAAAQRAVNKATGVLDNSPAEFREALENYYHAIEGK